MSMQLASLSMPFDEGVVRELRLAIKEFSNTNRNGPLYICRVIRRCRVENPARMIEQLRELQDQTKDSRIQAELGSTIGWLQHRIAVVAAATAVA